MKNIIQKLLTIILAVFFVVSVNNTNQIKADDTNTITVSKETVDNVDGIFSFEIKVLSSSETGIHLLEYKEEVGILDWSSDMTSTSIDSYAIRYKNIWEMYSEDTSNNEIIENIKAYPTSKITSYTATIGNEQYPLYETGICYEVETGTYAGEKYEILTTGVIEYDTPNYDYSVRLYGVSYEETAITSPVDLSSNTKLRPKTDADNDGVADDGIYTFRLLCRFLTFLMDAVMR